MGESTLPLSSQTDILLRCLAGLQAGVLGGLAMLAYFSVDAVLRQQRWNSPEILMGTVVYGNWAIWHGHLRAVLAGAGFQIVAAGFAGLAFAFLFAGLRVVQERRLAALTLALTFAFAWYWLWYAQLFPRVAPLVPQYTAKPVAIAAHTLLGLFLSRIPALQRELLPLGSEKDR